MPSQKGNNKMEEGFIFQMKASEINVVAKEQS